MWLSIFIKLIPTILKAFGVTKPLWLAAINAVAEVQKQYEEGTIRKDDKPVKWYTKIGHAIYAAAGNSTFITNLVRELAVLVFKNK